jgi:DNA-binding response OmpR family regulator
MKNILVVDDSSLVRVKVKRALEEEGFQVTEAASGEEALKNIGNYPIFDLIIMDIILPGRNGLDTIERIKENPRYNLVPVMILSVSHEKENVLRAIEMGAVDFLVKPFDKEELLARVQKITGETPWQKAKKILKLEINRSFRTKVPFSVIMAEQKTPLPEGFKGSSMKNLKEVLEESLRSIDTVIVLSKTSFLLVLPATLAQGIPTVIQKVSRALTTKEKTISWYFASAVYPENGENEEQLLKYVRNQLTLTPSSK